MNGFVQRHRDSVMGMLSGFDRLRFRGTLRWLCYAAGLGRHMSAIGVRLTQFKEYTQRITAQVKSSIEGVARAAGRPIEYLASPSLSKEERARAIAERDGIREGLIGVLYAVEPCNSFRIGKDPATGYIEVYNAQRKCLHYYSYWMDPQWGFCHVRAQTWFPLTLHVYVNGREWLAQQMDRAGMAYERRLNCFTWIEDLGRAQALMDRQLNTTWAKALNRLVQRAHPDYARIIGLTPRTGYYWSADESEWATDVLFRSAAALAKLYPRLIAHGMRDLGSREVMRFLGRRVPARGGVHARFGGEVVSDVRERPEGVRIKHRLNRNAIKMYDKQGSVLRVETTINDPWDLRVFRPKEGSAEGPKAWRPLRKGVADMYRRSEVSQAANERYLASLAAVEDTRPLGAMAEKLCRSIPWKGKRVRALNPLSAPDATLLEAVNRGEFMINGFRNRDLRALLYGPKPAEKEEARRQSAAVTRKLRMLRAHSLIRKVQKTHRYMLTKEGTQAITALLAARAADTAKLASAA